MVPWTNKCPDEFCIQRNNKYLAPPDMPAVEQGKSLACECFQTIRDRFDRLFGDLAASFSCAARRPARDLAPKPYPEIEAFQSARPPYPREVWDASRFSPLSSLIRRLYLAHTASEIMTTATNGAKSLLLADGVTFVLKDGDFSYYAEENAISPLWKGRRFPMHDCISG